MHPIVSRLLAGLLTFSLLAGCASGGGSYAAQHPELPAAHRRILTTGKISAGTEVAGMTRAQVRLAMGGDPATFDKAGGEDAWIYLRKKAVARAAYEERGESGASRIENTHSFTQSEDFGPRMDVEVRTTIYFTGDLATHADITEAVP